MVMTLSLEDGVAGGQRKTDLDGSEFNLPTLFGDHALAYECLIRQLHGTLEARALSLTIASHIDHGLERLKKSRSLIDLAKHSGLTDEQA
jgi:DNA sulfur modification protein DndE